MVGVVEQVAAGARHTQQEGRHLTQQQRPPDGPVDERGVTGQHYSPLRNKVTSTHGKGWINTKKN